MISFKNNFLFFVLFCFNCGLSFSQENILTLEEAVSRALGNNNLLKANEYGYEKASWDKSRAISAFLPTISFNTRYMRIDDRTYAERDFRRYLPEELQKELPQTVFQETYSSSFDIDMPLFNGVLLNGISIANANKSMSESLLLSTRQNIIFQVIKTYLEVYKTKEMLNLQKEYLDLSKLNYEKAERLASSGRYSSTEALRWKVEFEQQKNTVVQYENLLRTNMTLLNKLMNSQGKSNLLSDVLFPEQLTNEVEKILLLNDEEILNQINLSNDELVRVNAQLNSVQAGTEISRLMYKNNYSAYLPVINASYSYGWRENNTLKLDDYSPKTFMINVNIPIFSGFQNYTKLKSSYYEYKQNEEQFKDQVLNTRYLLTETVNRILSLKTQRALANSGLELSKKNYSAVEKQKESGLVSNIDFIDAKLNYQNSALQKTYVQYDLISGVVELYYMLGKIEKIMNN